MSPLAPLASAAGDGLDLFPLVAGVSRLVGYLGFVLVVGTTFFLGWLWPRDSVEWVYIRLFRAGVVLSAVATALVAWSAADGSIDDAVTGWSGALALGRISLLALGVAFTWEMLGDARRWRLPVLVWQLLLIETSVADSDAWREPWALVKVVAMTGHLAATAAWLGGLLALAAILVPRVHLDVLRDVLPRFSVVAVVSVVMLVVTGALHALAVAGSVDALFTSAYGTVLAAKVVLFVAMLLLGEVGRRYAARRIGRVVGEFDDSGSDRSIRVFAVAVGAELALAIAVLATTAALVHVAPSA
jgi:putative copper export protein